MTQDKYESRFIAMSMNQKLLLIDYYMICLILCQVSQRTTLIDDISLSVYGNVLISLLAALDGRIVGVIIYSQCECILNFLFELMSSETHQNNKNFPSFVDKKHVVLVPFSNL